MNLTSSLSLLLIALASRSRLAKGQETGHFVATVPNIVQCFDLLRESGHLHWPLEDKSLCDVSSVFGPAISTCTGGYRFNRSLAIHGKRGDVVKAPYDGTVVKAEIVDGDTAFNVVIEHQFQEPCEFHGHSVSTFYTTLDKLESISVEVGQVVSGGDEIGAIGDCVRHCGMSLLLGLRIGVSCSLSYANRYKANNDGSLPDCNNRMFDPHVNPHLLSPFTEDETHFTLHESECWGPDDAGVIEVDSLKIETGCAGADINRYEVTCGDKYHVIDFNMRQGFDASSSDALHIAPDGNEPYVQPAPYKHNSEEWTQEVVIPDEWYRAAGGDDCCTVRVYDTWGNTDEAQVCGTSRSYISMFQEMQSMDLFAWPTPESPHHAIFSSFGVRSESAGSSSFHKGVDIQGHQGDPVLAVYEGKVVTMKEYQKGGKTVMIQHKFLDDTATKLNIECGTGDRIASDTFYTQYQHLHNFEKEDGTELEVGDIINTGDQIGTLGKTGDETITDELLHFELRFGSRCSLKYCTAYLDTHPERAELDCCQYGFDPMIHPFLLFDPVNAHVWFEERTLVSPQDEEDGRVYLHTRSHEASINAFEIIHAGTSGTIDCTDDSTYDIKKKYRLDYSVKTGFHTWKLEQEEGYPRIEGVPSGSIPGTDIEAKNMEWRVDVVTPYEWLESIDSGDRLIIHAIDVWGESHCDAWELFP